MLIDIEAKRVVYVWGGGHWGVAKTASKVFWWINIYIFDLLLSIWYPLQWVWTLQGPSPHCAVQGIALAEPHNLMSSSTSWDQLFLGLPLLARSAKLRHLISTGGVFAWLPETTQSNPASCKECYGCSYSPALCGITTITLISHFSLAETDWSFLVASIHYCTVLHSWHMCIDSSPCCTRQGLAR